MRRPRTSPRSPRSGSSRRWEGYRPDLGPAFSTYAVPTILGELKRHLRDHTWAVHLPRGQQERALRARAATYALESRLGRTPTTRELADALGLSLEDTLDARQAQAALDAASLDIPITAEERDGDTRLELQGTTDPGYGHVENAVTLEGYLTTLDERTHKVLRLRFHEGLTQAEIGRRIGCSQMHVSRLIRQGLERLRALADR